MKIYAPINLDLDMLQDSEANVKLDKCLVIINRIIKTKMITKEKNDPRAYVRIPANSFKIVVSDYAKYIVFLSTKGIIDVHSSYYAGEFSKGYRLNKDYRTKIQVVEMTNNKLIERLKKERLENEFNDYSHIRKWINANIEIDLPGAIEHIERLWEEESKKNLSRATLKYNHRLMQAHAIEDCEFVFSIDDTSQRAHTNITNLSGELRPFVTYAGKELVSVDMVNAQPFFLAALLNPHFLIGHPNWKEIPRFDSTVYGMTEFNYETTSTHSSSLSPSFFSSISLPYIMLPKFSEGHPDGEYRRYVQSVSSGRFYEEMAQYVFKENPEKIDRRKVKKLVFAVLFSGNQYIGQKEEGAELKRIFKSVYPFVYEIIRLYKLNDKARLARMLQKIESELILKRCCIRITIERPDLPILTLHDCIVTWKGEEKYIARVIQEESKKAIGLTPSIKFDYWIKKNKP